jgi:hypothetical protein
MAVAVYSYTATEPAFATGPLGRTRSVDWFVAVFTRVILIALMHWGEVYTGTTQTRVLASQPLTPFLSLHRLCACAGIIDS